MTKSQVEIGHMMEVPDSAWKRLEAKKIYFGHQSVGFNIVQGMEYLRDEHPHIKLRILETCDPSYFDKPIFAHSKIGKNRNPTSKIQAFAQVMDSGIGDRAHIAFLKLCYIDINTDDDPEKIFLEYKNIMKGLKEKFPRTTFMHLTVPLMTNPSGIKPLIKKLLRMPSKGMEGNIKRNQYNELLINEYEGREPIFDLARIESTYPDGKRESFVSNGKTYFSLVPHYTYDGGHLNEEASRLVAAQLLVTLSNL